MRLLILFGFLLLTLFGFSQSKLDSLTNLLKNNELSKTSKVDLLNSIGFEYWIVDSKKSISYGKQAYEIAQELDYKPGLARANRVMGVAYWTQGNYVNALQHFDSAKKLFSELEDKEGIANIILNEGMVHSDLRDYDKALKMYDDAINKFEALGLKNRIATTYTKIGSLYLDQNKPDYAKVHLDNAIAIHTENGYTYGIAEAHNRLGIMYLNQDELEQAFYHISKSINLGRDLNDKEGLTSNLLHFGILLSKDKQYNHAYDHIMLSLNSAKENGLKRYELLAYNALKEVRLAEGKAEEAIMFYDKYSALKDSLYNTDRSVQIAALQFQNELDNKSQEVILLKEKEKNNRIMQWALSIGLFGLIISSIIFYIAYRKQNKQREELNASKELISRTALENAELKQKELSQELEFKNKELTSYTLNFVQKNELFQVIDDKLSELENATPAKREKGIREISRLLKQHINIDKNWNDFKRVFEEVHSDFIIKLKEKHEDLSANDLKVCALTRLNLNIKETASMLGITPESVKTARYRLRKKLNLEHDQDLFSYFISLEQA